MLNPVLQTIVTDLSAGLSYLEKSSESVALRCWGLMKSAFIALEPAELGILLDVLSNSVVAAGTGSSIEQIETAAMNSAKDEEVAVLAKTGSAVVQQVIAGLRTAQAQAAAAGASLAAPPPAK